MRRTPGSRERFYSLVSEAIADIEEHGFDSEDRVKDWAERLEKAARAALIPERILQRNLRDYLERAYSRALTPRSIARTQPGIAEFTVKRLSPKLRAELDRRLVASTSLITLNREASIQRQKQRFLAWSTSVQAGGTRSVKRGEEAEKVRRGISGLPFEERRVIVDQSAKLVSAINDIIATEGGAIAGIWHHVKEGGGYQARPNHEARDGDIFVVRDNWAIKRGLMKLSGRKYTDQIEQAGELVYCRCWYEYLSTLADLPTDMITEKGKLALADARQQLRRSHVETVTA